jgi:hypothetical protein
MESAAGCSGMRQWSSGIILGEAETLCNNPCKSSPLSNTSLFKWCICNLHGSEQLPTNIQSDRSEHSLSEAAVVCEYWGEEVPTPSGKISALTKLSTKTSSAAFSVKHVEPSGIALCEEQVPIEPSGIALCEEQALMSDVCVAHWFWFNKEQSV